MLGTLKDFSINLIQNSRTFITYLLTYLLTHSMEQSPS